MISLKQFIPKYLDKSLKQTTRSSLSEIKIQPNGLYKVGDHFDQPDSKGDDEMIITDIKDENVYYDTVDGYWADMGTVNFRSKQEFNKLISSGKWVILPQ